MERPLPVRPRRYLATGAWSNLWVDERKPDAIVHFAAEIACGPQHPLARPVIQTNFNGTFSMLDAARRRSGAGDSFMSRPMKVITAAWRVAAEADEEFPLNPSSPYSASKAGSDFSPGSYFVTYKLPVLITQRVQQLRARTNFQRS
jgi:dTDP-glucose 4,6-dehydratase